MQATASFGLRVRTIYRIALSHTASTTLRIRACLFNMINATLGGVLGALTAYHAPLNKQSPMMLAFLVAPSVDGFAWVLAVALTVLFLDVFFSTDILSIVVFCSGRKWKSG